MSGRPLRRGYRMEDHPLYHTWRSMKRRCTDPNWRRYDRYGGRGIRVCDRWMNGEGGQDGFACFIADVGDRPAGTTLDRVDNDGHYEPGNVRWATKVEQQMNSSQMAGRGLNIMDLSRRSGLAHTTIRKRLDMGWSVERAISTQPPEVSQLEPGAVEAIRRRYVPRHPDHNTNALAKEYGVSATTVRRAIKGSR